MPDLALIIVGTVIVVLILAIQHLRGDLSGE